MCLNVLYELPDDDSREIETFSNVVCHLLNWGVPDWRVFLLLFYLDTALKSAMAAFTMSFQSAQLMYALLYIFHINTHLPLFQRPSVNEELNIFCTCTYGAQALY